MTQFYQLGGAEHLAIELAEELNNRHIHTDILSLYSEDLPGVSEMKSKLHDKGIPFIHFLGLQIHPPLKTIFKAILKFRKLIVDWDYDIVETSSVLTSTIASCGIIGTHVKQIAGLHQVFKKERENSFYHKIWRLLMRINSDTMFYAISDFVASQWVEYSKISQKRVVRIYNAISNDFFNIAPNKSSVCKEFNIPFDANIAIYTGRLAAYKGIDTIIHALGPVLKQNNLFLLYIGLPDYYVKGTKETLFQIKQLIAMENWESNVKFIGYRKDIARIMGAASVLVHPTRIEGFGLTLAEAMAVGLPIVASNVEGIPEVLKGTSSIMISPDDPIALRNAVLKIIDKKDEGNNYDIEKGKLRAKSFGQNIRVNSMIKLFEDILYYRR